MNRKLFRLTTIGGAGALAAAAAGAQVTFERIRDAASEPASWLTHSGDYGAQRYSALEDITPANAAELEVKWVYQMRDPGRPGFVEATPLVDDGILYFVEPPHNVTALDAWTGARIWSFDHPLPDDIKTIGFPPTNRGVALLGDKVYFGTLDAKLFALDAGSGAVRWSAQVGDNSVGHAVTMAPLAIDGKIIVGISGGEAGIRGFVDAYDAETGERAWRFWTIPEPGEPGGDTWAGDSWKQGSGATWLTGSYDAELDLLYWGVGNPGPDWNGDVRPGDNLYTCSVIALDPDTGELVWHFQYTPHDTHDWDANQMQVLVDVELDGQKRKLLTTANRNAFYYVLDRTDGSFITARPYAKQTWADGMSPDGRPKVLPNTEPTEDGNLVYPSLQGATNWYSPSYSPQTELFYVAAREMGAIYFKSDVDFEEGTAYLGGGQRGLDGDEAWGAIRALDVRTGEKRWEFRLPRPPYAGLMATGGGVVFGGTLEGNVFALDAETGAAVWDFQSGGPVRTNPMSFAVDGQQRVAIAGGNALFVFGLAD
ncbi:MAG: PQQ-dependent dehydrogenase, methanol/ethanol family [Acidobacteriota bacterium]|nr:PQQ-dependent dehydrogenase, methanol/ethanol family [Acidobacteriota bacterium]